MIRLSIACALAATACLPIHANAAAAQPPKELTAYVAAMRKADEIKDPVQRCLAYPDLPGSAWAPALVKARCEQFLTPAPFTLEQIDRLLDGQTGAASLAASFREMQDAPQDDPGKRERVYRALSIFSQDRYDLAERVARKWLAADRDSAFAMTALGNALADRGWNARGAELIKDTSEEKLERMTQFFTQAAEQYLLALQKDPKLQTACLGLMRIGRQSSDQLQAFSTDKCLAIDPVSYYVLDEMMTAAEPRWGGSDAAMRGVAAYAQARVDRNVLLSLFAYHHAFYEIDRGEDTDRQALEVLEPAARQVPNVGYLRLVGGAYLRKGDYWASLSYLSQALRFSPALAQESRFRALNLMRLGETRWARADAERAVQLDPSNGHASQQLGKILRQLDGPLAAAPHFRNAMADGKTREDAYNDYCAVLLDARNIEEARACIDGMLAEYPRNPEAWRQRLYLIGFMAPQSREALERFLELKDPTLWSYHAKAAESLAPVYKALYGQPAANDAFEQRVHLANAEESTLTGKDYFEKIKRSGSRQIGDALTASNPAATPANFAFTMVFDVQADGSVRHLDMRPDNASTKCLLKRAASWKMPIPPPVVGPNGYPMVIQVGMGPPKPR